MPGNAGEAGTNSLAIFSSGPRGETKEESVKKEE